MTKWILGLAALSGLALYISNQSSEASKSIIIIDHWWNMDVGKGGVGDLPPQHSTNEKESRKIGFVFSNSPYGIRTRALEQVGPGGHPEAARKPPRSVESPLSRDAHTTFIFSAFLLDGLRVQKAFHAFRWLAEPCGQPRMAALRARYDRTLSRSKLDDSAR
jgi:hypothetical protein